MFIYFFSCVCISLGVLALNVGKCGTIYIIVCIYVTVIVYVFIWAYFRLLVCE